MAHSFGYRGKTRHLFRRPFRGNGPDHLSTYLKQYKKGMFVDIVANGAYHKGMPHKFYHGRTGRVFDVTPNSIGVMVNKQVRNRIVEKRIHVRVEHLRISTCNANFLIILLLQEQQLHQELQQLLHLLLSSYMRLLMLHQEKQQESYYISLQHRRQAEKQI